MMGDDRRTEKQGLGVFELHRGPKGHTLLARVSAHLKPCPDTRLWITELLKLTASGDRPTRGGTAKGAKDSRSTQEKARYDFTLMWRATPLSARSSAPGL